MVCNWWNRWRGHHIEDTDENAPKRANKSNAFHGWWWRCHRLYDDDPEDERTLPDSDSLEYDDDSEDDEKAVEVESCTLELNEIIPDDDLDDVELSEEDDDDDYEDESND